MSHGSLQSQPERRLPQDHGPALGTSAEEAQVVVSQALPGTWLRRHERVQMRFGKTFTQTDGGQIRPLSHSWLTGVDIKLMSSQE